MKIKIPKRHSKYIDAMFNVGILEQEADLVKIFKFGMDDVIGDLIEIGSGEFPPDMDKRLLQGKQTELKIPYELSEDENEGVKGIEEFFKLKREYVLSTFFLMGLFLQWDLLRDTERYENDPKFRKLVDEMPHDLFFEECVENYEDEDWSSYSAC